MTAYAKKTLKSARKTLNYSNMQAEFKAPRRRARVREDFIAALPVTSEQGHGEPVRAELVHNHVLVSGQDHIQRIYGQGFFGKGILSRSRPEFSFFDQWKEHKGQRLPVLSASRYQQLLSWAELALSAQGLDAPTVNQILYELSKPVEAEDAREEAGPINGTDRSTKRRRLSDSLESKILSPDRTSEQDQDTGPGGVNPGSAPRATQVLVSSDTEVSVRRCPVILLDHLQLSPEEAFFLVYSLGCLSVSLHQEPLSVLQLWRRFRSSSEHFVCTYAAYHHFRSKGWVAKVGGGAKYGVDLMLYRKGPPFYHASYSVVVEKADNAFTGSVRRPFSWRTLAALSRITANVSKELLLCYVIFPEDLSEEDLDSPVCLSRLKVQEVVVSRWVSSRERADQEGAEEI